MDNSTVINPAIQGTSSTVINSEVIEEYNRQNNIEADASSSIAEGTVICEKYKVQSQLEVSSGEADRASDIGNRKNYQKLSAGE